MRPDPKNTHWHDDHKRKTNVANFEGTMIPNMKKIVPFQDRLNFKVYNTNPDSSLRCFEFKDINEFL
jgi:hypothetical protein